MYETTNLYQESDKFYQLYPYQISANTYFLTVRQQCI